MRLRSASLLALAICASSSAASCAGRGGMVRWEDVEPASAPPEPAERVAVRPAPVALDPKPSPPPTPPASTARIAAPASLVVNGVNVEDGALTDVPALDLACIADPRALVEPAQVLARLADGGQKVGASLGSFTFVVLERDPARSLTDPPPLTCRPLQAMAPLLAPLLHKSEPASRWLVRRAKDGVVADTAALLADCDKLGLSPSARPRVIVDSAGALVALAIPVTQGGT